MSNYLVVGQEAIGYPYVEEMSADSVGELIYPLNVMSNNWGGDVSRLQYQPMAVIDTANDKAYNFKTSDSAIPHPDYDSERYAYVYDEEFDIANFILVRRPDYKNDAGDGDNREYNKTVVNLDDSDFDAATASVTTANAVSRAEPMFLYRKQDNEIRRLEYTDSDGWGLTTTVHKLHTSSVV